MTPHPEYTTSDCYNPELHKPTEMARFSSFIADKNENPCSHTLSAASWMRES